MANLQRLAELESKLPALERGEYQPASNQERLVLAELCRIKKRYRAATRLSAEAFANNPMLGDDLAQPYRYNAACAAVLAATGAGEDASGLDEREKTRLRKQAVEWLRADLIERRRRLEANHAHASAELQDRLRHWQRDRDLASIREEGALAQLRAEERQVFVNLWVEVAALLKKAEGNGK
jgi:hypothetical protein